MSSSNGHKPVAWKESARNWLLGMLGILIVSAPSYLLWRSELSEYEKWEVGTTLAATIVVLIGGAWAIISWFLTKKIEMEIQILENVAKSDARWRVLQSNGISAGENVDRIEKRLEDLKLVKDTLEQGKAGFRELRLLNRRHHYHVNWISTYGEERDKWKSRNDE